MAHLEAVGAGGRASADVEDNVALLCVEHHDMLDGRRPYDAKSIRAIVSAMDEPYSNTCRWPTCNRIGFESGLCYPHMLLTDPRRIDSTRRFEFSVALAAIVR